jgi:hypothetical protein
MLGDSFVKLAFYLMLLANEEISCFDCLAISGSLSRLIFSNSSKTLIVKPWRNVFRDYNLQQHQHEGVPSGNMTVKLFATPVGRAP